MIELLAVIVILGVIALIITPVITGVIKKQEKKTFEESVRGILKSIEIDLSDDDFNVPREYFYNKGKLTLLTVGKNERNETIKTNGKLNGSGYFLVDIDGDIIINKVCDETYCISNSKEEPDFVIKEKEENEEPVLDLKDPIITLNGDPTMYVELGSVWKDPGATAKTRGGDSLEYTKEIKEGSIIIDSIDTSREGTYKITYSTTSNNKTVSVSRTVAVLNMNPVITITEPKSTYVKTRTVVINVSSSKTNTVSSFDVEIKKDGASSSNETVNGESKTITLNETGIYEITVTVKDNNNHTNTVTKTYKIDTIPPELIIPEDGSVKITEVSSFDPKEGVTATDNTGITPKIEVSGELGSTLGTYQITYKAIDEAGNEIEKTRTITVVEAEGPILNFSDIGSDTWRKATTIKLTATDNNNLGSFTYEIFKDNVSQGLQSVSVNGKSAEKSITLNQDGIYTIKLTGSDQYGNTSTAISSTYKIDVTAPTLTLKSTDIATITQGDNVQVSSYYNTPIYSISGGSMSCNPTNTSELATGTRTVSCTARGGNGLTKSVNKTVIVNPKAVSIATKVNESSETRTNDPGGNRRYVGSNPNNYVRFNNELWRIIGIFNGQAKIIRNEFYSTSIAWSSNDVNDWNTSPLKEELNGAYLNSINSTYKNMIDESHVWNLGGIPWGNCILTRANSYNKERGTEVYSGRLTTWTGAIGLMYPSDYGYSTSAEDSECVDGSMAGWDEYGNVENCKNNSWLYKSSNTQWTFSTSSSDSTFIFIVRSSGSIYAIKGTYNFATSPVLYLKSDVKITSGTGSSTDPYQLSY